MNQSGQESAPFEVLVSVIIMGFVLFMAIQAIEFVSKEQCKAKIKDQLIKLKQAIESAVRGNSAEFVFNPKLCFKETTQLKLQQISNQNICTSTCGKVLSDCLMISFRATDYPLNICADAVPTYTNFHGPSSGSQCPDRDDFELVNFKDPVTSGDDIIPSGTYSIQNITGSAGTVPQICAYRKTG